MTRPDSTSPNPGLRIDWEETRGFLRGLIARKLDRLDDAAIDDLTQEALVRLLRALRRETPDNLDAFTTTIGNRTVIDFIRSRKRWAAIVEPLTDVTRDTTPSKAPPADQFGDPLERVRWTVLRFFESTQSDCLMLANHYFAERDWKTVSDQLGKTHQAIRRQWSRCIDTLRREMQRSPGLAALEDWA